MNSVLKWLQQYINDDKLLVDYLYIILKLFDKNWKSLYNYIDKISNINPQISEIISYFKEENYKRKHIYELLQQAIQETWYNVYELKIWENTSENIIALENPADIVEEKIESDVGIYAKSADNKIYKRFLLDDVKKILKLD